MDKLVEEIIKPILEASPKIKKVIGIYGGRFQPFGPHHYKTYKWLDKQVNEAYITTSNIKKPPRHPMNFKEKVRHMTKMGVKANRIVEEKTPYVANNVMKKFNKDTTAVVYIFGQKDAGRLKGGTKKGGGKTYYQDFKKNKKNLEGYETHGYILTAPHVSISVGGKEVSGTSMRELLGSNKYDDKQRAKLFKQMFGYYDKGVFTMMSNKFKKLFENVVTWDNTKEKPMKKKWKDGKDRELIHDVENWLKKGSKKDRELKLQISKLYSKAFKMMPGSPNQKKIIKQIEKLRNQLSEDIFMGYPDLKGLKKKLKKVKKARQQTDSNQEYQYNPVDEDINVPIKIGDTVLMGKFKNKKVVVKTIGFNEKGDMVINGKSASKFRLMKQNEDVKVIKKSGKDGGDYREYEPESDSDWEEPYSPKKKLKKEQIEDFLTTIDFKKLIESTQTNATGADDGPNVFYKKSSPYQSRGHREAGKLGWEVVNYIMGDSDILPSDYPIYPNGPVPAVSWLPAGVGSGNTPNNQVDLTGNPSWTNWLKHMKKLSQLVGYKLIDYLTDKEDVVDGTKETQKVGTEEEPTETKKKPKDDQHDEMEVVKESLFSKNWWSGILNEGGAYGHMAHPFDDNDLTFGDLKKIITLGLGGQLSREDNVTEKLDGQNIMVSWRDGKLIAARNKGHIKNGGKTALDTKGIISKFKGRGDIKDAFVFAMKDLEKAIKSLSQKQKDKIFNNGYNFMNLEVMWPKSANVVDYDKAELIFHGALRYDDSGKVLGEVPGSARILAGMIQQRNQNIQKKYKIGKPNFLTVPKHQDFGKMKGKFLGKLNKLQARYGLKDNDTLALYHQKWWEQFILKQLKKVSPTVLKGLVKRWAFFDKSYKIPTIKQDLKNEPIFLEWVLKFDKENHAKQVKENMRPFEILFFEVGAEILKNVKGFMAANPDKAVQNMIKNLDKAIKAVKSGGDVKKLSRLKTQLDRLEAIGGTKAIVPSEGIVFKYKGKTYKFTGAFAPVNQITGLIYF